MSDKKNDGVVDGPGETEKAEVDTDRIGPDGTVYDQEALDEVARKMKLADDDE